MKEKKCQLCLEALLNDFQTVGDLEESLYELLFELNLDIPKETVMCHVCTANLKMSLNFVSSCLYAKGSTNGDVRVDLAVEKKCHFCSNSIEEEDLVSINELMDVLQKRNLDLKLQSADEILSCQPCLIPLQNLLSMLNCLDANKMENEDLVELNNVQFKFEPVLKYIECSDVNEIGEKCNEYQQESIIENLDANEIENNDLVELDNVQFKFQPILKCDVECSDVNEMGEKCDEYQQGFIIKSEIKENDRKDLGNEELDVNTVEIGTKLEVSNYESFQDTPAEPVDDDKAYSLQYEMCALSTDCKTNLEEHDLIVETPSITSVYNCEICTYRTNYKGKFKTHVLSHTNQSENKMHKCTICTYKSKYKAALQNHMLKHKNPSEVRMYKCRMCTFQTIREDNLTSHIMVVHRLSATEKYKCEKCPHETKYLEHHPSEIVVYKCSICTYKSKYKIALGRHILSHQSRLERLYTCELCTFKSKWKSNLTAHIRSVHKFSETKLYKCDICPHVTMYKRSLVQHMSSKHMETQEEPSEVVIYRCEMCTFETKVRSYLDQHMMVHSDPSEVTMFKCGQCAFDTKYKGSLVKHMLYHKNASKLPVYT